MRDFAQVHDKITTDAIVQETLTFLAIDNDGLTQVDHLLLRTLTERFNGGPAGIETLASVIGEDAADIRRRLQHYLPRKGYLKNTSRS